MTHFFKFNTHTLMDLFFSQIGETTTYLSFWKHPLDLDLDLEPPIQTADASNNKYFHFISNYQVPSCTRKGKFAHNASCLTANINAHSLSSAYKKKIWEFLICQECWMGPEPTNQSIFSFKKIIKSDFYFYYF